MKVAYHRCGVRVRFDPEFLKKEEERREEKKVYDHRGLLAFRGFNCAVRVDSHRCFSYSSLVSQKLLKTADDRNKDREY